MSYTTYYNLYLFALLSNTDYLALCLTKRAAVLIIFRLIGLRGLLSIDLQSVGLLLPGLFILIDCCWIIHHRTYAPSDWLKLRVEKLKEFQRNAAWHLATALLIFWIGSASTTSCSTVCSLTPSSRSSAGCVSSQAIVIRTTKCDHCRESITITTDQLDGQWSRRWRATPILSGDLHRCHQLGRTVSTDWLHFQLAMHCWRVFDEIRRFGSCWRSFWAAQSKSDRLERLHQWTRPQCTRRSALLQLCHQEPRQGHDQ